MKKDNSANNFNYVGLSIDKIINNPDEYIVPECQEACKKFWDMNIFTASCSNRREYKGKDGKIKKYIMKGMDFMSNKLKEKDYLIVEPFGTFDIRKAKGNPFVKNI